MTAPPDASPPAVPVTVSPCAAPRARWPISLLLTAAFIAAFVQVLGSPAAVPFEPPVIEADRAAAPQFERGFMPNPDLIEIHSPSLLELGDGRARAFWISGNEGSPDAVIGTAVFDRASGTWGPVGTAATAGDTGLAVVRYVKKVGNGVARRDPHGRIWLFYVTVSVGGWAGSSINVRVSADDGATWGPARRLITTPFLNLSTLVRNTPVVYQDGSTGLPAYHEFITKCAELLRIDADGHVVDKQRLNTRFTAVQPLVLVQSPTRAIAMMRNAADIKPRRVIETRTDDGGRRWSAPTESPLHNPGSPVAGAALPDGRLLVVANNSEWNRRQLSLLASADQGASWRLISMLDDQTGQAADVGHRTNFTSAMQRVAGEAGIPASQTERVARFATKFKCYGEGCDFEYSYPSLTHTADGQYLLVYTWNRTLIAWARFNQAWIDQQMRASADTRSSR
ncbi:MAG TPA: exo-alpha-sialidase [Burkholderiaceae bacterium]|nr:exo-alpha-sialidase [Burkholderiaceae bacterium]